MISAWRCWQTGSSSLVIIEVIVNARNDDADAMTEENPGNKRVESARYFN